MPLDAAAAKAPAKTFKWEDPLDLDGQLTEDEQRSAGVNPGLVRLSVGLESIDDILADLDLGFAAIN